MTLSSQEMYEEFRVEMVEIAQSLDELLLRWERDPGDPELPERLFRQLHTLKGSAGFLELFELADVCHAAEDLLSTFKKEPRAPSAPLLQTLTEAIGLIRRLLERPISLPESGDLKPLALRLRALTGAPADHRPTGPASPGTNAPGREASAGIVSPPRVSAPAQSDTGASDLLHPTWLPTEPGGRPGAEDAPLWEGRRVPARGPRYASRPPTRKPVRERLALRRTDPGRRSREVGGERPERGDESRTEGHPRAAREEGGLGPWSPERLDALSRGRSPSELRGSVILPGVSSNKRNFTAASGIDPIELLIRGEGEIEEVRQALASESEAHSSPSQTRVGESPSEAPPWNEASGRRPPSSATPIPTRSFQSSSRESSQWTSLEVLDEESVDGPEPHGQRRPSAPAPEDEAVSPPAPPSAMELIQDSLLPLEDAEHARVESVVHVPAPRLEQSSEAPNRSPSEPRGGGGGAPGQSLVNPAAALSDSRVPMSIDLSQVGQTDPNLIVGIPEDAQLFVERAATVRVDVAKLDSLLNLMGDLLQEKHQQTALVEMLHDQLQGDQLVSSLVYLHRRFERLLGDLQDAVLSTRMLPVQGVFRRYPHIVRDLAARLGKEVELTISGEETELDRALLEGLFDPLIHLLRNSIDHGIEPPLERVRSNKSRRGTIHLSAAQEGNQIVLEIRDDGRGINPDELVSRAIALGLLHPDRAKELNDQERIDLIFLPGFTSRTSATETSGRGVGMSVVRDHLRRIGGLITVQSRVGEGTTLRIAMPLTLAILQVLLVRIGTTRYAIPLSSVVSTMRVDREQLTLYRGGWYLPRPGQMLPVFSLASLLGIEESNLPPKRCYLTEVGVAEKRYGIWSDGFAGIFESVIKSLEGSLTRLPGVAGGTFIGSGELVLVLDMGTLLEERTPGSRQ